MKSRNLFVGILILFVGVVALLATLRVFEFHWSIAWTLWPLILIICGISMLPLNEYLKSALLIVALGLGCLLYHVESRSYEGNPISRFINRHVTSWNWSNDDDDDEDDIDDDDRTESDFDAIQHFSEPFNEVAKASINIDFGAGDLEMKATSAELAKVDINSNLAKYSFRSERGNDMTSVYVTGKGQTKSVGKNYKNDIKVALCTLPVWDLTIDMGAADADLDLSAYKMENININGGACDLDLKLGDNGCNTKLTINTGASDIDIQVPANIDCRINLSSAITGKDFRGFEKIERDVWQTPGFGQGEHQIIIDLTCAVSDLSVERY